MTMFDDRERAFEQMFVHNEEARFRALARRNKMLGQWAAEQLDLSGERTRTYIDEISHSVVAAVVDEALAERIRADFEAAGVSCPEDQIREKMAELMAQAVIQVRTDEWKSNP
ncbi:DUF1476 domain-containing protein [Microvirga massiliensis]|uniref:DUF1476 domain-containing protein n=1 Tax=Microvirga massiliensis TaxID=1033741 RepID=UPI00062BB4EE|nr:DUF1476 domain-containing protein [Microvirga massiliensis]